jgi:hypothetical protein
MLVCIGTAECRVARAGLMGVALMGALTGVVLICSAFSLSYMREERVVNCRDDSNDDGDDMIIDDT